MNLIRKLKIWKELKRLEARVRENPVPATFVDLGQVYINLGMNERTLQLAEEGLALFPRSDELTKLRRFAKKTQLNSRIRDLRTRLDRGPQARLYRELANLYLEQGDFDLVQRTCDECSRHFPDDDATILVLAKARLTNFYRDLSAQDGIEAVRCLNRVIAVDSHHVKGRKMLAELLFRVDAKATALQHLEVLKGLVPEDADVGAMYDEAVRSSPFEEDLETIFQRVEANGAMTTAPVRPEPAKVEPSAPPEQTAMNRVREALAHVADFAGVRKAAYIRGSKALVRGDIKDGRDSFLRVARIVAKAAQRAARRMDIGKFNKGALEGPFGQVCLCSYGEVVAAVLCDPGTDVDKVLAELQELVAGSLYTTEA